MDNYRGLMDLAANAAGICVDLTYTDEFPPSNLPDGYLVVINSSGGHSFWNPLDDDGDSRRLAVALEIRTSVSGTKAIADWWRRPALTELDAEVVDIDGDPCAALRLATLRAAAEIGKSIQ